jgi:hypothetical protein
LKVHEYAVADRDAMGGALGDRSARAGQRRESER